MSIQQVKDWLYPEGVFNHRRLSDKSISKRFPEVYTDLLPNTNISEAIFCYINNITEKPVCKSCSEPVNFKNFNHGYREFCSNLCVNKSNSLNKKFSTKISVSRKNKFNDEYYIQKYGYSKVGDKFLYHGNLIDRNKLLRIMKFDVEDTKKSFIDNWEKVRYKTTEDWTRLYFPLVYKEISLITTKPASFQQKKFMYINDVKEIPKCTICNKKARSFNYSSFNFNLTCCSYNCIKSTSMLEKDVHRFVASIYKGEINTNFRIDNNEIDIYMPDINFGIEVNGIYWHSEKYKDKDYHINKKNFFVGKGIDIFYVWEDDWLKSKMLLQSMISNKLGLSERIFGRKCKLQQVTYQEAKVFHQLNHLRGYSIASKHYGLYYQNRLVSCMSIGKSRYDKNSFEIIRFSTEKNINVLGGFSKILKHISEHLKDCTLVSYADADFSNGKVYYKTGFVYEGFTGVGFHWFKDGVRYSRQSLWKVAKGVKDQDNYLRSLGYVKVWNCGNYKFSKKY